MKIQTGAMLAVVVNQHWARLQGVSQFLGNSGESERMAPQRHHNVQDDSHTLYANVLDDEDPRGLWVELNPEHHKKYKTKTGAFLIPWNQILGIAVMQHQLCSPDAEERDSKAFRTDSHAEPVALARDTSSEKNKCSITKTDRNSDELVLAPAGEIIRG